MAELGHEVACVDVDQAKVRRLQQGGLSIYEPGLDRLVAAQMAAGRLQFVGQYEEAIPDSDAIFICVGTPSLPTGQADTSAVEAAARCIGESLRSDYCVIINKSTVPVGTGDRVERLLRQTLGQCVTAGGSGTACHMPDTGNDGGRGPALPRDPSLRSWCPPPEKTSGAMATVIATAPPLPVFDVVSNPEFLREGSAIPDAHHPDRIVVGANSERAVERMRAIYAPLVDRCAALGEEIPFIVTDRTSAEMIKYAANAFLATKVSFINEIANICERVGADALEVVRGVGADRRIGASFLNPGIGWGGSCFPKDLASLTHIAGEYDYPTRLLDAVREINADQRLTVVRKLQERLKLINGRTVALWGLAFKPGTDDLRDAPSLTIAERLAELGAELRAYDPHATGAARRQGVKAHMCADLYEATQDADALVLLTEWPEFARADWSRVRELMRRPIVVDGRNALDRTTLLWHGFEYSGIGR
jgi:UDPglucose 6-dehydrogenase